MNSNQERGYRVTATEARGNNSIGLTSQCQHYLDLAGMGISDEQRDRALFELEKLLTDARVDRQIRAQKVLEEKAAQERVWGDRIHSVAEFETFLDGYLTERELRRKWGNVLLGNIETDRAFCHEVKNFMRRCLKLPLL